MLCSTSAYAQHVINIRQRDFILSENFLQLGLISPVSWSPKLSRMCIKVKSRFIL